ncbi:unnamed protein product [Polarella glacialis]|uniref:HECT-type E3 ubiquitin transferase n=1 Tax=Polarella glacialis TaxID=89957 RepID=A0A813DVM2_POLGL|nr:unnamed protein product [Polarella glacialis]
MEATVRLLDKEPTISVQVHWRGAELTFLRSREEPVEIFLKRLGISCGKHSDHLLTGADKKRAKKDQKKKPPPGGYSPEEAAAAAKQRQEEGQNSGIAVALLRADGERVTVGALIAQALSSASHLEIEGERLPILVNPPSVQKLEVFGRALAGCPLTASIRCEFCEPSAFRLRWMLQVAAGTASGGLEAGLGSVMWVPEESPVTFNLLGLDMLKCVENANVELSAQRQAVVETSDGNGMLHAQTAEPVQRSDRMWSNLADDLHGMGVRSLAMAARFRLAELPPSPRGEARDVEDGEEVDDETSDEEDDSGDDEAHVPGLSPRTPAACRTPHASSVTPAASSRLTFSGGTPVACRTPVSCRTPVARIIQAACGTPTANSAVSSDLDWLVQEASNAPLPCGWSAHIDSFKRTFYFHKLSQRSVWEHPGKALYRELLGLVQRVQLEVPFQALNSWELRRTAAEQHLRELHQRALRDLEGWSGPYTSPEGVKYYYSDTLKTSAWQSPIEAWEQQLEVSHRILGRGLLNVETGAKAVVRNGPKQKAASDGHPTHSFRSVARGVLAAQRLRLSSTGCRRCYEQDKALNADVVRQIDLDIPRTAGGDPELMACLGTARSLLLRHAAEDPELGYCQGMNMVACLFSVAARSQAEAYARFHAFTQLLRGLWLPGFPLLQEGMCIFESLAQGRPWFQHLQRNDVGPETYLPRAWLSLFASWLSLPARVLLLRELEKNGLAALLAISLALLDHIGPALLEQGDDTGEILTVLEMDRCREPHPAALIAAKDVWIAVAINAAARRTATPLAPPPLRREGSRVLDRHGHEAIFGSFGKQRRRLSAAWAGKALLRFSFAELPRKSG